LMEWPPLKENEFFVYKSGCKIWKRNSHKIPINNAESVSDNVFLHFVTAQEKYIKKWITES
jgi:hypothetical protein